LTVRVENLQADQTRAWRNADIRAGREARDVTAVAIFVGRLGGPDVAVREVVESGNARIEIDARLNARIDDGDAHRRRRLGVNRVVIRSAGEPAV
jgi:hypothetical protein